MNISYDFNSYSLIIVILTASIPDSCRHNCLKYYSCLQSNMTTYKNRLIPDDEWIRKNKKIEIDAKFASIF